jgi:SAM-dependent methyltransferase
VVSKARAKEEETIVAHNAQAVFFKQVRKTFPEFFRWKSVLEVGSLDINGSVRPLFQNCNYLGVDLDAGPGVDLAVQGQELAFPDKSFDVTISAECFEHNPFWRQTFMNMKRMTKEAGLITFTCAGKDRPEHGTYRTDVGSSPLTTAAGWTYYKNLMPEDFDEECLSDLQYQFFYNPHAQDLYFVALKLGGMMTRHMPEGETKLIEETDWNGINAESF